MSFSLIVHRLRRHHRAQPLGRLGAFVRTLSVRQRAPLHVHHHIGMASMPVALNIKMLRACVKQVMEDGRVPRPDQDKMKQLLEHSVALVRLAVDSPAQATKHLGKRNRDEGSTGSRQQGYCGVDHGEKGQEACG